MKKTDNDKSVDNNFKITSGVIVFIITLITAVCGSIKWMYDKELSIVQYKNQAEITNYKTQLLQADDKYRRLQNQLSSTIGSVQFVLPGKTVSIDRSSLIISRNDGLKLLQSNNLISDGNILMPDFKNIGYSYTNNIWLKQLISLQKDGSLPLPESNNPESDSNPLWWPKCWIFHKDATDKDDDASVLVLKMNEGKSPQILSQVVKEQGIPATNLASASLFDGLPPPLLSFGILGAISTNCTISLNRGQYVDGINFAEGTMNLSLGSNSESCNFTFTSFSNEGDLYLVLAIAGNNKPLSTSDEEVRSFIKDFKVIRK